MMSHFYSPLHHMYGSLHAPRYPVDQKYPPPPLLEQKYHQYPAGGNGGEDQTDLRYGAAAAGEKYPESGDSKMPPCHKPISSPSPLVSQQQQQAAGGGSYADRHFLSSPAAAAGGGLSAPGGEDVKPLDKLQLQQHQLHNHHQDKSSESSDYESKEGGGGGYTPEQAGSGLYSPGGGGGGYYHQPGNAELVPGGESPDHLAHPAYGGYSTTFGGLANPLVRPRSNKNKTQAGALKKMADSEKRITG
jgi:hypothetical protein